MVLELNREVELLICEMKVVCAGTLDFAEVFEMHLQAMLGCIARHVVINVIRPCGND